MLYLRAFKPIQSQAFAQGHARTMEHDPQVALGNGECCADFLALYLVHFSHHENGSDALWQFCQAITHRFPKFVAMHHFVGFRLPFFGPVHVHPIAFRHEFLCAFVRQKFQVSERGFASPLPVVIADFVLQDSAKPAPHRRTAAKSLMRAHRGQECLLHEVLSDLGFAYTLKSIAIENIPMLIDPARGISCRGRGQLRLDIWLANATNSSPGPK